MNADITPDTTGATDGELVPDATLETSPDAEVNTADVPATTGDTGETDTALDAAGEEREWWDDPSMPWNHKPTRTDIAALAWMGVFSVWSVAMLPLKGWLIGTQTELLLALTGSRTTAVATGALVAVGEAAWWWVWALLIGNLMSIKFDWIYWWAGKLWGRGMLRVWAGQSEKSMRRYERAEHWAHKLGWIGMFVAYIPIPLPLMQVVFVLTGSAGMSWKKFIALDFVASAVSLLAFLALGYGVGEPAVEALRVYTKFANYVAIALVVVVFVMYFVRSSRKNATVNR